MEKLEEWTAPEKPKVPKWRQSFDISIHPVPKGAVLMISFVVTLLLSLEYVTDDRPGMLVVHGTTPSLLP